MRVGEGGLWRSGGRGDCGQDVFIQEKNIFPPPKKKRERDAIDAQSSRHRVEKLLPGVGGRSSSPSCLVLC